MVHEDIDASFYEGMKDSSEHFILISYNVRISFKIHLHNECKPYKIIIQLQIGLEIALFYNLEYLNLLLK